MNSTKFNDTDKFTGSYKTTMISANTYDKDSENTMKFQSVDGIK
jgi:hypothetical protein